MDICFLSKGIEGLDVYPNPNQGSQTQIWGLAKEFAKKGHTTVVIKADNQKVTRLIDGVIIQSIKVARNATSTSIIDQLSYGRECAKLISKHPPDVLSMNFRLSSISSAGLDIPKTYTMHSPDGFEYLSPELNSRQLGRYALFNVKRNIEQYLCNRSDVTIGLNHHMVNELGRRGISSCYIPNAVDIEEFNPSEDDSFILFAGRFDWNKRPYILIDAYNKLSEELQNEYRLILVGEGKEEINLRKRIQEYHLGKQVEIIPWLPRKSFLDLLARCSLLVLPSLYETFGLVLVEAMAFGKPVVASTTYGSMDIIENGVNGILFEKNDFEGLVASLDLLIRDEKLRRTLGRNGRKYVEERYSFKRTSDMYLKIFNDIIEG